MGRINSLGQPLKFDIQDGGDAASLIIWVERILTSESLLYGLESSALNQLDRVSESLSQEEILPTILVFDNKISCPFRSEIVINKIGTYRLAAVRIGTENHSVPIICSQEGQYFKLDERAEEISEEKLSDILTNNTLSPSAYYIKVI